MFKILTPIVASVFAVYLTIGITLGILPSFIQHNLAFGNLTVGITIGLQSLATLLTRAWSGRTTDTKGPHTSKRTGVILVLAAGLVYMLASASSPRPGLSLALILLSRLLHGASESLVVTGALTWGIGLLGHQHSGKVMTWNGIAMYAGIAAGAPLGIWMTSRFGVTTAFLSIPVLALISAASTLRLLTIPVDPTHPRPPFYKVIRQVAPQGLGLAFSSMGFACIATFISLLFTHFRWGDASASTDRSLGSPKERNSTTRRCHQPCFWSSTSSAALATTRTSSPSSSASRGSAFSVLSQPFGYRRMLNDWWITVSVRLPVQIGVDLCTHISTLATSFRQSQRR